MTMASACARRALWTLPLLLASAAAGRAEPPETAFLAENHAAMDRMMTDRAVKPSGDVALDFVATMIKHHQDSIEMAEAELRHGHNETLRRIAQEIVVEQQQEITAIRLALGQKPPPSRPAPDQFHAPAQIKDHTMRQFLNCSIHWRSASRPRHLLGRRQLLRPRRASRPGLRG
jgi:hypothetical protein